MNIELWLNDLDLSEYINVFKEESIDMAVLPELSSDDLKEIGMTKLGHRKIILKAISELKKEPNNKDLNDTLEKDELTILCKLLPKVISSPLTEYISETNPGMKLWFACDTTELLIRFLVILGLSDLKDKNKLDNQILKQFWGKIEMPTLGAWMVMAKSLTDHKNKSELLIPEIYEFIRGPLTDLIYGSEKPGTPETSFLSLRNRLAHGGGLNNKEANRLINNWKQKFENCLNELSWISDVRLCGVKSGEFINLNNEEIALGKFENSKKIDLSSDSVFVLRNNNLINLWPLILFGTPQLSSTKENLNKDPVTQVYVRKDVIRLQFTPLDVEGYSQTEKGEDAINAFNSLFDLDNKKNNVDKKFQIQDFTNEIIRDASQMVGRFEDQNKIEESIKSLNEGVIWLTGTAGIGKSFLSARLMRDLEENNQNTNTLILSYRFKIGDNTRCNREAFSEFIKERLMSSDFLDIEKLNEKGTALDKLKSCFDNLKKEKKVIILLDGMDEINIRDKEFTNDIPISLNYSNITWVCFGRPEPSLEDLFKLKGATMPFPEGLPPMSSNDIRGMIIEKIGPLKKKLLSNDKEANEIIVNPFIDLVVNKAEGLPLYVKYVIGDVLANRYRVLDGEEILPDSLHAYHEKLLNGLGISDLKFILTPLAALLAVAFEPLSISEIKSIFVYKKFISNDDNGEKLIENGLSAIAPMLRRAPDPEGEEGYTLFHFSLREHILKSKEMVTNVQNAKDTFCELARKPDDHEELKNYLYRAGIDHFIDSRKFQLAGKKLLNLYWLFNLFNLNKTPSDINGYWYQLPITFKQMDACYLSKLMKGKNHGGYNRGEFGTGKDWVKFMENEVQELKKSNAKELFEDTWLLMRSNNSNSDLIIDLKDKEEPKEDIDLSMLMDELIKENIELSDTNSKANNKDIDQDNLNKANEDFLNLFEDLENEENSYPKKYKEWCESVKDDYEYFEPMKDTEVKLPYYQKLLDFFLLSRLCHSGVELSARICRLHSYNLGGTNIETIMSYNRLSSFYALMDGQNTDNKYDETHLFYDPKYSNREVYGQTGVTLDKGLSLIGPDIFRHCLSFISNKYGLKSNFLTKLLQNPYVSYPEVGNLNIKENQKSIESISDLLKEVCDLSIKTRGENHPSSLVLKLNLANRLYFDMKLKDAQLIIKEVHKEMLSLFSLNDDRTTKALHIEGNVEFELGNFQEAKKIFKKLIFGTERKYTNEITINEWRAKLAIIELVFQNFESVENLCYEGLIYFNNTNLDNFFSISEDRTFLLIDNLLKEFRSGIKPPSFLSEYKPKELVDIINFYSNRGLFEVCLFILNSQGDHKSSKIKEILILMRSLSMPRIFRTNINYLFDLMTPRQERCVRMRYGYDMNTSHSLDEIAMQFEVTSEEIKKHVFDGFKSIKIWN